MPWFDLFVRAAPPSAMDRARRIAAAQRAAEEERRRREGLKGKAKPGDGGIGSNPDTAIARRPIGVRSGGGDWGMCWIYRADLNLDFENFTSVTNHYILTCFSADGIDYAQIERTTQYDKQFWNAYYVLPVSGNKFMVLTIEYSNQLGPSERDYRVVDQAFYLDGSTVSVVDVSEGLQSTFLAYYLDAGASDDYARAGWVRTDEPDSMQGTAYGSPSIYEILTSSARRNTPDLTAADFGAPSYYRVSLDPRSMFAVEPVGDKVYEDPERQNTEEPDAAMYLRLPSLQLGPDGFQRILMVDKASITAELVWSPASETYTVAFARNPEDYVEDLATDRTGTVGGNLAWDSSITMTGNLYWSCPATPTTKTLIFYYLPDQEAEGAPLVKVDPPDCFHFALDNPFQNPLYSVKAIQLQGFTSYRYSLGYFTPCFSTSWGNDYTAELATYGQVLP